MTVLTAPARDAVRAPELRARFRDLLAAEWIKLWSLRSTSWVFGLSALVIVFVNADAAFADYGNYPHYGAGIRASFVPYWAMHDAFGIGAAEILMLAASSIGAIAVVSEYGIGLIRTTFAAVPARRSVIAAKMTVVAAAMLVLGVVISATSFWVSQAILSGRHVGLSIAYPGAVRHVIVSALLAPVCALVGMGIGVIIRHSGATIVTATLTLLLGPFLIDSRTHRWVRDIHNAMPLSAWQALASADYHQQMPLDPTMTGSWIVFAAWPLAAMILALIVIRRRDV